MKTEAELMYIISKKYSEYAKGFGRLPDTILLQECDYDVVRDNPLVQSLVVQFNYVTQPILYKR